MTHQPTVAVIDHSLGNLFSVRHACRHVGLDASITADPAEIDAADALILPGVGAFGNAMETLHRRGLLSPIRAFAASGRPTIGVCLGLQLFMDRSDEFGHHEGLGLIEGTVERFFTTTEPGLGIERGPRVPQVGWNRIRRSRNDLSEDQWSGTPLDGLPDDTYMYFVHSYYVLPSSDQDIVAVTAYEGFTYCSVAGRDNVLGVQFHPERSDQAGLAVYDNIARQLRNATADV